MGGPSRAGRCGDGLGENVQTAQGFVRTLHPVHRIDQSGLK